MSPNNTTVVLSDADDTDGIINLIVGVKRAEDAPEMVVPQTN